MKHLPPALFACARPHGVVLYHGVTATLLSTGGHGADSSQQCFSWLSSIGCFEFLTKFKT